MRFQDNLGGTFAGTEERPRFSLSAFVVTCQQVNVPPTPDGFRGFRFQVAFQLFWIDRVCLRDAFNWHLSIGTIQKRMGLLAFSSVITRRK